MKFNERIMEGIIGIEKFVTLLAYTYNSMKMVLDSAIITFLQ
ncbi:MAG: hypothetical protein ACUVXA_06555 [Candidatus Jordarchaeum sp.]